MNKLEEAIAAIEAQQPKVQNTVWCVGEQLKDILRREPEHAESIIGDLKNKEQTLAAVEKKIAALAGKQRIGNCGCVTPMQAEKLIRETYGMEAGKGQAPSSVSSGDTFPQEGKADVLNLEDFL